LTAFEATPIFTHCASGCYHARMQPVEIENQTNKASEPEDERWMRIALDAAFEARSARDEVPIGACIVSEDGKLLAVAGNRTRTDCDPTAHAEILALREAAKTLQYYRLTGATVYSTIEPCAMCAGALVQARVKRLVYGARDERYGAVVTMFGICDNSSLNHRMEITEGVLELECKTIIQDFFQLRRKK
jgi:tRNA(adenine34) deaminase